MFWSFHNGEYRLQGSRSKFNCKNRRGSFPSPSHRFSIVDFNALGPSLPLELTEIRIQSVGVIETITVGMLSIIVVAGMISVALMEKPFLSAAFAPLRENELANSEVP